MDSMVSMHDADTFECWMSVRSKPEDRRIVLVSRPMLSVEQWVVSIERSACERGRLGPVDAGRLPRTCSAADEIAVLGERHGAACARPGAPSGYAGQAASSLATMMSSAARATV